MSLLGKPLFEMCWYYVGIAQVALDPSPPLSNKRCQNTEGTIQKGASPIAFKMRSP